MTKADLAKIVELLRADVQRTLAKKQLTLTVTPAAKDWLIAQGDDSALGARPLRRVIAQAIRDQVTDFYLAHQGVQALKADVVDDQIEIIAA